MSTGRTARYKRYAQRAKSTRPRGARLIQLATLCIGNLVAAAASSAPIYHINGAIFLASLLVLAHEWRNA